jgi:hypothetical protein
MVTQNDRISAYTNASEEVAHAYGSMETAIFLGSVREKYSIPKGNFTDIVGDTLLKLRPRTMFEQGLITEVGLTPEVAKSVTQELKSFFDKAEGVTKLPEANLETKERLELRPNPPTGAPVEAGKAGEDKSAAKPLTREELMNALGGKRTMAADIEALRQKREEAKNAPVPPPAPPKV